jgi:hypothetical protein
VLVLYIAVLNLYIFKFLTTNIDRENMYWECKGNIFNCLNNGQKESLFLALIIILTILFLDLQNSITVSQISPKYYSILHHGMYICQINHP